MSAALRRPYSGARSKACSSPSKTWSSQRASGIGQRIAHVDALVPVDSRVTITGQQQRRREVRSDVVDRTHGAKPFLGDVVAE